jgi:hypothetical protein
MKTTYSHLEYLSHSYGFCNAFSICRQGDFLISSELCNSIGKLPSHWWWLYDPNSVAPLRVCMLTFLLGILPRVLWRFWNRCLRSCLFMLLFQFFFPLFLLQGTALRNFQLDFKWSTWSIIGWLFLNKKFLLLNLIDVVNIF